MDYVTLDEYINSIITENNIDESINCLIEATDWNTSNMVRSKENAQLFTEFLQNHLLLATSKNKLYEERLAELEKDIKPYQNEFEIYEKSLWSVSSNGQDNANWLLILEEKNQHINLLKKELLCYKKADEDCDCVREIDDIYLMFHLDSLTQQILEREQEVAFLKDIEKSMKEYMKIHEEAASSEAIEKSLGDYAGNFESLKDEDNKNDETNKLMNKKEQSEEKYLQKWKTLLSCLSDHMKNINSPFEYWMNRLYIQKKKHIMLVEVKKVLAIIDDQLFIANEEMLSYSVKILSMLIKNYMNSLRIHMFTTYYEHSSTENYRIYSMILAQLKALQNITIEYDEFTSFIMLNKRNSRVMELEDQYAKLTEKSDKRIQNQVAVLNENLVENKTKIETVRNKCEKSIKKYELDRKIATAIKYTSTLDAENIYSTKVEKQQEEPSNDEEMNDDKEMSDESEATSLHLKDDQTSKESQEEDKKLEYCLQTMKHKNCKEEEKNKLLNMKYKIYKDILTDLLHLEDIDNLIAARQAEYDTKAALKEKMQEKLSILSFGKQLLYYSMEQANYIQKSIRRGNKYYDNLLKKKVAKNTCVRSQNNASSLKCDTCKISDKKLHFATNVICDVSQKITIISAMFHMLPFKRFFKAISKYIMTKEKAGVKRRELEKRTKQTKRTKPTKTFQIKPAEQQELSDQLGEENTDSSMEYTEEHFNNENSPNNIMKDFNRLIIENLEEDVNEFDISDASRLVTKN